MTIDPGSSALTISMQASGDGSITLELPRESIGATAPDGSDAEFTVLVDGSAVQYAEEQGDSEHRRISIDFASGASEIAIAGTYLNESGPACGISLSKSTLTFTLVAGQMAEPPVEQSIRFEGTSAPSSITIAAQDWTVPSGPLDGYVTQWKIKDRPDSPYQDLPRDGMSITDGLPAPGGSLDIVLRVDGTDADSDVATTGASQTLSYVVEC